MPLEATHSDHPECCSSRHRVALPCCSSVPAVAVNPATVMASAPPDDGVKMPEGGPSVRSVCHAGL